MIWVICNTATWSLFRGGKVHKKMYKTESAAKGQMTKHNLSADRWKPMPLDQWRAQEPKVIVRSMMNGAPVEIAASDVGNPALDPSTEGYFCM